MAELAASRVKRFFPIHSARNKALRKHIDVRVYLLVKFRPRSITHPKIAKPGQGSPTQRHTVTFEWKAARAG
jgi:hypothetical protein